MVDPRTPDHGRSKAVGRTLAALTRHRGAPPRRPAGGGAPALTTHERHVVHLLHQGRSASEVAGLVGLPLPVLAAVLTSLRERFGVTSTRALVERVVGAS